MTFTTVHRYADREDIKILTIDGVDYVSEPEKYPWIHLFYIYVAEHSNQTAEDFVYWTLHSEKATKIIQDCLLTPIAPLRVTTVKE